MTSPSDLRASIECLQGVLPAPDAAVAAGALALFDARDAALERLRSLAQELANPESELAQRSRNPNQRNVLGHERLFRLQSYVATTWSLYEVVLGLAGRLLTGLPRGAMYSVKDLLEARNAGSLLRKSFEECEAKIWLAYAVRNVVLHAGGLASDGTAAFETDTGERLYVVSRAWRTAIARPDASKDANQRSREDKVKRAGWTISEAEDLVSNLTAWHEAIDGAILRHVQTLCAVIALPP